MLLRSIALVLALVASLATIVRPALAKDGLVIGLTQYPSTWNPLIGAMLAKTVIQDMTARPFTVYGPDWKLRCMLCTELPTIENGKARVVDLPDGKKGMEIDFDIRPDATWGDGTPVTVKDVEFTIDFGKHPQSGVASSESYRRVLKITPHGDKKFTMTVDRVTFDYNSTGLTLLPAHIEKPIFEANPLEYRNRNSYDTNIANPGIYFGPYRVVSATPGSQVVLERNPTWWGAKPFFRRIVVRTIENSAALEANLLSGSVDYILGELGLSIDQAIAFEKRHKDRFIVHYQPAL
ncbi:MAG: ABC transporter substrate-binding protein, partial [Reyranellaceae bacterium]